MTLSVFFTSYLEVVFLLSEGQTFLKELFLQALPCTVDVEWNIAIYIIIARKCLVIFRWFFSDRTIYDILKRGLDPVFELNKPKIVGR